MSDENVIESDDIIFNEREKLDDLLAVEQTLEQYNMLIINYYRNKHQNNVLKVAETLKIGKSTIYRMLKEGKI